ncbi:MAG: DUF6062 family protein [Clostridiales bacterium]|nr:DUF6062 family protein [Clostridiales bacterium]MDY4008358.1 DUF6062 family protein [Candidatus Limiplasma sp.]
MQYHLDTIPVWEVMEKETACPLCELYGRCELDEIDRSLGGSVMEPDARIRVNERGICQKHHKQLFLQKNRLGHALLTDSHTKELLKKIDSIKLPEERRGLFPPKDGLSALIETLKGLNAPCVICENIQTHMERYLYTFIHLWKTDQGFRAKWEASQGVCLPHAAELLAHAQRHLNAASQRAFAQTLLTLVKSSLAQDEKDLEWFTLKFDYRNHDKPWGNSRNALQRTINRLRGRCIDREPDGE